MKEVVSELFEDIHDRVVILCWSNSHSGLERRRDGQRSGHCDCREGEDRGLHGDIWWWAKNGAQSRRGCDKSMLLLVNFLDVQIPRPTEEEILAPRHLSSVHNYTFPLSRLLSSRHDLNRARGLPRVDVQVDTRVLVLVANSLRRAYVNVIIGLGFPWNRCERMRRLPVLDSIQISSFGAVCCRIDEIWMWYCPWQRKIVPQQHPWLTRNRVRYRCIYDRVLDFG